MEDYTSYDPRAEVATWSEQKKERAAQAANRALTRGRLPFTPLNKSTRTVLLLAACKMTGAAGMKTKKQRGKYNAAADLLLGYKHTKREELWFLSRHGEHAGYFHKGLRKHRNSTEVMQVRPAGCAMSEYPLLAYQVADEGDRFEPGGRLHQRARFLGTLITEYAKYEFMDGREAKAPEEKVVRVLAELIQLEADEWEVLSCLLLDASSEMESVEDMLTILQRLTELSKYALQK